MKFQLPSRRSILSAAGFGLAAGASNAQSNSSDIRAVLDTDTYNEIDDQFAVAYALLSPEAMSVEAIYAAPFLNQRSNSPGDGMEKSYEEILRVLDALGESRREQVFKGSQKFMSGPWQPVESDAARDLIQKALRPSDGRLYVITVGAPTNVSSAILMEPRIKERITVIWLGGQPYTEPSAREFNLQQDPHASRVLYDTGVRLVNIPTTNVSEKLRITIPEIEQALKGKSRIADYLLNIFIEYAGEHRGDPSWSKVIWDISAVAWLINPGWIPTTMVPSPILTGDLTWKSDPDRHGVRVATNVDRDAVYKDLFTKLASAD